MYPPTFQSLSSYTDCAFECVRQCVNTGAHIFESSSRYVFLDKFVYHEKYLVFAEL